jgi:hypothetical protein
MICVLMKATSAAATPSMSDGSEADISTRTYAHGAPWARRQPQAPRGKATG